MKKWAALLLSLALLLALAGCGETKSETKELFAMDTVMSFTIYGSKASQGLTLAESRIQALDAELSVTNESSEIYALNRDGSAVLSDDAAALLQRSLELSETTGGAFSPTLYALTSLWGFTTGDYRVPSDDEIRAVLAQLAAGSLTLDGNAASLDGVKVDLGGIAKGYASQDVAAQLKSLGVKSAILSLGGNIQTVGVKPDGSNWNVAIRNPADESTYLGVLSVGETAVVTSGGYQRYFEQDGVRYIHIMDPATGYPVDNGLTSVTIVAQDGTMADSFSTALYVMGLEKATEFWRSRSDFEAVFVTADGAVYATEGLKDSFQCDGFTVLTR